MQTLLRGLDMSKVIVLLSDESGAPHANLRGRKPSPGLSRIREAFKAAGLRVHSVDEYLTSAPCAVCKTPAAHDFLPHGGIHVLCVVAERVREPVISFASAS